MRTVSGLQTFAALALLGAAVQPHGAAAQPQPCTAIQNDAERLACYDRALRPAAPPAPSTGARTPVAPAASTATTTIATEDRASRRERRAREAAAPEAASPAPAAVDPVAPAPAPSAAAPASAPTLRTAPRSEAAAPGVVPIVVVEIRGLPGRQATFVTDQGDVWVQTDDPLARYPETPFKASIKPGAMSSFFLVPEARSRAIRVRKP